MKSTEKYEEFESTEDMFLNWNEENEMWYNKYFVIPVRSSIYAIMEFPSKVKWFYQVKDHNQSLKRK